MSATLNDKLVGSLFLLKVGDGNLVSLGANRLAYQLAASPRTFIRTDWRGTQQLYSTARTNNCPQSQTLGAWTPTGSTIASDATTAPDGTLTADKIQEDAANSAHNVAIATTIAALS